MDQDAYLAQLLQLLPSGPALPRDPASGFTRLLGVPAAELARVDARGAQLLVEALPDTTDELLLEWERAFGLPDECSAGLTLIEQRRAALLARITERLSPSIPTIEALAASYGVRASVVEHRPHTCESSCEDPINDEAWAHAWTVWGSGRVIWELTCEDDCEQPLRLWSDLPHECALRRLAPAHTVPLFGSFTDEWSFLGGLPAGATFTRPAPANRVNSLGATESMGVNVPRLSYQAGLEYNLLLNPWFDGAVAGTPGTPPPDWTMSGTAAGVTREIIGTGIEAGVPFLRVAWRGTASVGGNRDLFGTAFIPAAPGEVFTTQLYAQIESGTLPRAMQSALAEYNSGAGVGTGALFQLLDGTMQALPYTHPPLALTSNQVRSIFRVFLFAADEIDCVIRYGFPTLTRAATPITDRVPLPTLAARINAVPQYGLLGMMLEASASEELRLAVPDGLYTAQMVGATPAGVVATYPQPLLVSVGGSLRVQWPAAAVADGANHLRSLILRKVA